MSAEADTLQTGDEAAAEQAVEPPPPEPEASKSPTHSLDKVVPRMASPQASVSKRPTGAAISAREQELTDQLVSERERHDMQLRLESKAREELEDMLLRLEKQYKMEQAARAKAEELMNNAIMAEMETAAKLEDATKAKDQGLEAEKQAVKKEREALEEMRQTFELQLEAARNEVAKAQRVVANGGSDGPALAKAQAQVAQLQGELSQAQANLAQARQEVERWRNQAQVAARGLQEAHHELFARKREIDSSKQRMDALLDNLGMASEGGSQDPPSPKGQAANGRGAVGSSPAGGRGAGPGPSMRGGRVAPGKVPSASDALQRGSGVAAAGQLSPAGGGRQVKSQPPVGPPRGGGSSLAGVHLPPLPMNGGAQAGNAARNGVTVMMHNPNGAPYQPPPFNPISPSGAGKMAPQPMFGGMMMHPAFANGGAGAGSPGTRSPKATAGMGAGGDQFAYVQPKVAVATAEYVQKQRESIAQSRAAGSPGAKDRFGQGRVNAEVHLAAAKGGKW